MNRKILYDTTTMAFRTLQSLLCALPSKTSFSRCLFKSTVNSTGPLPPTGAYIKSQSIANFSPIKYSPLVFSSSSTLIPFTQPQTRNFHVLANLTKSILQLYGQGINLSNQIRTVTKFSMRKGRRKTVKAVVRRFYRLDWGIWIRPRSGRHKKLWKKGKLRRKRLRQHVFTNAWQTRTLERMTTKYWHKKKYWVDDPYESYHTRDNFRITKNTRNIVDQLV